MTTPPPDAPTCYRHPGRETYIRCQRCDRPICPDCQIPAAVGFQCPECVAAGRREVARQRTVLGGLVTSGTNALVTMSLVGICVIVYAAQLIVGDDLTVDFGMIGAAIAPGHGEVGIATGEYYRLITAAFLHGNVTHILVNMLSLWIIGPPVEALLGRSRFLSLYLLGAVAGTSVSYMFGAPNVVSVGASGAIFAVFGALIAVSRRLGQPMGPYLTMLAINAAIGFLYPGIDWRAHVGGLVAGLVLGGACAYAPRGRVVRWFVLAGVGVAIVAAVLVVVRTQQLLA